jgi:restriction system protein
MARKKPSFVEDLIDTTSKFPWQAGVVLAAVTYLALHYFATRAPLPMNPAELKGMGKSMADAIAQGVIATVTSVLQYVLPLLLLLGSLISFMRRRRQGELHRQVASDPAANALEKMTWREFEGLAAEAFRKEGYRVVERGGDSPDGGVDLELHMGNDKYLVQCKQWKTSKVGVATVRELYGVMTAERAIGGFVVASGAFTDDAKEFAEGRSIKLVDARRLRAMIGSPAPVEPAGTPVPAPEAAIPTCPKCGSQMVRRTAKTGSNAGNQFWGCSKFPACRGVRN